ncbi:DNA helicase UvrD [Nocardia sp. 852002-20019_SCH5090214]|uniref:3'-5' exonuclease n=1 Tax=Nocardia TaxID=1817 RepID=UPI0007EB3578|nr:MULTISPECIES: 3'-5' exonuclease [Nocardia]OBF85236.1 DNA helicase UvrD [Mycobacterium sp. 852002-51759_SCH5129042]MBF6278612.1 DEAD/DEAH box helicase [Nocardia nova]OBA51763.1 DNA helicase UvrD [Nocardia sp. 852002-51101_SCH5132738]OBA51907.1 DNA helicase UvrD [Nocardia sp. 852002-20019_SCH5090214]OBB54159.1 DNA helicase UvrD [Nocardia sp. 852002-51244_SCH5132740]
MANIVIATNTKAMGKLDGSVRRKAFDFLEKLQTDDTAPGLHIEPIKGAVDSRVRTGRVDLNHRAVLFRLDPENGGTTYVYMGTWKHDVANAVAEQSTLRINKINGIVEGVIGKIRDESGEEKAPSVAERTPSAALPYLAAVGFTLTDLTDRLGLDPDLAARALHAPDDFAINDLAAEIDGWQGDALLDLACGTGIDEIREKYSFTEHPVDETLDDDSQIVAALEHPASKMQFVYVDDSEELRRVIEGGDFAAWRTFLHPEQRAYAEKSFNGPFRLSGGAGTGKTVVAIHRARNLARSNRQARIVLTTYNRTLAKELEVNLRILDPHIPIAARLGDPGIYVASVDKVASDVLARAGDLTAATTAVFGTAVEVTTRRPDPFEQIWSAVTDSGDHGLDHRLATAAFLDHEYVSVILANKVTRLEEYVRVSRAGRGVRLSRAQRIAVWKLVEAYRRHNRADGRLTFPEIQAIAAEQLARQQDAGQPPLADHVLVDEAQDLHATHWAMLRALVAEGPNDLFIAEDSHQRIYGQPVVLGRLGIKIVGRSRRLTLNYRTTRQNLHFAMSILSGADYHDLESGDDSTEGYRSARLGPNPQRIHCVSASEELDAVAGIVRGWRDSGVPPETIAVLTRDKNSRTQFVRALSERDIDARALDDNPATPGHVQVLTMHRAKGMEFSRVILAGVDDAHVPLQAALRSVPEEERAEAELRERSLLYVAASRARDELVVTWSGRASALLGSG